MVTARRLSTGAVSWRDARRPDRGSALLTVVLLLFLFSAIVISSVVMAHVEALIGNRYLRAAEARYAAGAGLEAAVAELRTMADWTGAIAGSSRSRLAAGEFRGTLVVPGAGPVVLCCGAGSVADALAADTRSAAIPARREIRWRPFLWAPLNVLTGRESPGRVLVVVWVGNDEGDLAGGEAADTNASLLVRSEAIEPSGDRLIVEALVAREPAAGGGLYSEDSAAAEARRMRVAVLNWREVR